MTDSAVGSLGHPESQTAGPTGFLTRGIGVFMEARSASEGAFGRFAGYLANRIGLLKNFIWY